MPAGRPRKHGDGAERLSFKASRTKANTLRLLIEYLNAHGNEFTVQDVLDSATNEYIAARGTLVEQAQTWWKKGRKPPKEEAK
jgi:hypothetical protein